MTIIYRPLGNEIPLSNSVSGGNTITTSNIGGTTGGCLVRVVNNTAACGVLVFAYSNGVQYANMTILPAAAWGEVVVWKNNTDLLLLSNTTVNQSMLAVQVAYRGI